MGSDYSILIVEYVTLLVLGMVLVLDNLRITICLGTLNLNRPCRKRIALSFGAFETLTPILGFIIGYSVAEKIEPWLGYIGPMTTAAYGIYIISLSKNKEKLYKGSSQLWLVLGLPFSLSLDNLMAGIGLGLIGFQIIPFAIIVGISSCIVSVIGFRVGDLIRRFLFNRSLIINGTILVAVSASLVFLQLE